MREITKVKNCKFIGWIKNKDLDKILVFTKKPKEKCVEVEITLTAINNKKK